MSRAARLAAAVGKPAEELPDPGDEEEGEAYISERLAALKDARAVVQYQVDKFTASPNIKFNKYKYLVLLVLSYATAWVAGNSPAHFWTWHLFQYLLLLPVQMYRWRIMKKLAYMVEFCWITNFCITAYLAICFFFPSLIGNEGRGVLFRMLFAFGSGPLGGSVVLTRNALLPHSIDHYLMLLIHFQPLVTAHTLKFHSEGGLFPMVSVDFWQYCWPPCLFIIVFTFFHCLFFIQYGLTLPDQGYETAFETLFTEDNLYTRVLGQVRSGGDENMRFIAFDVLSCLLICSIVAITYPLYRDGTQIVSFLIIGSIFIIAAWQGAQWYSYRIGQITSDMDKLVEAAEYADKLPNSPSYVETADKPFMDQY